MQLLRPEETEEMDFRLEDSAAVEITSGTVIGFATTGTDRDSVTTDTGWTIHTGIGCVITGPGDGSVAIGPLDVAGII